MPLHQNPNPNYNLQLKDKKVVLFLYSNIVSNIVDKHYVLLLYTFPMNIKWFRVPYLNVNMFCGFEIEIETTLLDNVFKHWSTYQFICVLLMSYENSH